MNLSSYGGEKVGKSVMLLQWGSLPQHFDTFPFLSKINSKINQQNLGFSKKRVKKNWSFEMTKFQQMTVYYKGKICWMDPKIGDFENKQKGILRKEWGTLSCTTDPSWYRKVVQRGFSKS